MNPRFYPYWLVFYVLIPTGVIALIVWFLSGCNTDTMNILAPTYEYQHQGRTRAQEHEFLRKTYPNDPGLWQ